MNLLNTLLIFCLALCFGATSLNAQNVTIPDANFKAYLVGNTAINTNMDGEIQVSEAAAFNGTINCPSQSIADLTGIEAFVNLTRLDCYSNQLTSLDVTQNTSLTNLGCSSNQLTSLNLSQNTNLTLFYCDFNQLATLDLSQNTSLSNLECNNNQLTSLNLGQNTNLNAIRAQNNQLTSLDVSQNTNLGLLKCEENQLTSLDVSLNTSLYFLSCRSNQLTSLDVSQNVMLTDLYCSLNQLTNLNIDQNTSLIFVGCFGNQLSNLNASLNTSLIGLNCSTNQLSSLNVKNGNNSNVSLFDATSNPNLTCIQVDDSTYSTTNWTNIDAIASFSANCNILSNINTINKAINLTAYPNPTTKEITLDFGKVYQEANIQISNLTGQVVLNKSLQNSSTTTLELEGTAGIYFVNIQTEEGATTLKIIKE